MSKPSTNAIAQALTQELAANANPGPANPGLAPPSANPFVLNQPLEQAAAPARTPMHPIVAAIMNHLGLLNMIRNQGNQGVVDPETPVQ